MKLNETEQEGSKDVALLNDGLDFQLELQAVILFGIAFSSKFW